MFLGKQGQSIGVNVSELATPFGPGVDVHHEVPVVADGNLGHNLVLKAKLHD
jgi:hypothetical protein